MNLKNKKVNMQSGSNRKGSEHFQFLCANGGPDIFPRSRHHLVSEKALLTLLSYSGPQLTVTLFVLTNVTSPRNVAFFFSCGMFNLFVHLKLFNRNLRLKCE